MDNDLVRTSGSLEEPRRQMRAARPKKAAYAVVRGCRAAKAAGLELPHVPVKCAPDEDVEVLRRPKGLLPVPDLELKRYESLAL